MKKHFLILFILIVTPLFSKENILVVSNLSNNGKINNPIISGILENKSPDQDIQIEYVNIPQDGINKYINNLNNVLKIKYENFIFNKIIFLESNNSSLAKLLFKDKKNKVIVDITNKGEGINELIKVIIKIQPNIKKIYIPEISLKKLVDLKKQFYPIDFESFSLDFLYLESYLKLMNHENGLILTNSNSSWKLKNYLNDVGFPIYAYNINKNNDFTLSYVENYYLLGDKLISSDSDSRINKEDEIWLNIKKAKKFKLKYYLINKQSFLYNNEDNFFLINKDDSIKLIIFSLSILVIVFVVFLIKWRNIIIKLDLLKNKAEISSLSKSKFLENMSHDMKTPLNTIINSVELIKTQNKRDLLDVISCSSYYLKDVINDILKLSELGNEVIDLDLKEISLQNLIQEIYEICYPLTSQTNLGFYIYLEKDILFKTDKTKLKQILINLINNAFKFTKNGEINTFVSVSNERITFHIEDTGIGIDKDKQGKIFDDFYRDKSQNIEGSGLGLAISKRYSNLLGSNLYLNKSSTKGSHFILGYPLEKINSTKINSNIYFIYSNLSTPMRKYFKKYNLEAYIFYDLEELEMLLEEFYNHSISIIVPKSFKLELNTQNINILSFNDSCFSNNQFKPLSFYNLYKKAKMRKNKTIYTNDLNVLVVEDNLLSAELLIENIKNIGVNCYHAKNSDEIFKHIKNSTLILMDISLGSEDGYELSKFFKTHYPKKFIIGLSASKKNNGTHDSLDEFLEKPIDFKKLENIISLITIDIDGYLNNLSETNKKLFISELKNDLGNFNKYYNQESINVKMIQKTIHKIKGYFLSINCLLVSDLLNEAENINYGENFYSIKFSYILLNHIIKEMELKNE